MTRFKKMIQDYDKFVLLPIVFLFTVTLSCTKNTHSICINKWKILYEQDLGLESVVHKQGWKSVEIPFTFTSPYPMANAFQFIWLQGEFYIDDNPSVFQGLSIGRISQSDRVYINGHLIGQTDPECARLLPASRNYRIPEGILQEGKNTIYIQLGIMSGYYGGISGDVFIQKENIFYAQQSWRHLIYSQIPMGIILLYFSCFISLLIFFNWNKKEKFPLYVAFGFLFLIISDLCHLLPYHLAGFVSLISIQRSLVPIFFVIIILTIQSIYRVYLSNYNRVIIPILLLFALILLFRIHSVYYLQINLVVKVLSLIISIVFITFMIYRLNAIKHDKVILHNISIMFVLLCLIIIFELYSGLTGGIYSDLISIFSPPVIFVICFLIISKYMMTRWTELQLLYEKLKKTEGGDDTTLSITDSLEEKLNRIIHFIDENFASDLSREELAAAVEINPNYMGSKFKAYTGKTIKDYINQIRIEAAMRQLQTNDMKIIDIALSVGFDNSVTFNRVFKNVTGQTPTEYKNSNNLMMNKKKI